MSDRMGEASSLVGALLTRKAMARAGMAALLGALIGLGCGLVMTKRWTGKMEVLLASPPPSTGLSALIPGAGSGPGVEYELFADILMSGVFLDNLLAQPIRSPDGEARSVLGWYAGEDSGTSRRRVRKLLTEEYLVHASTGGAIATISVEAPERWLALKLCSTVVDLGTRTFLEAKDAQFAQTLEGTRRSVAAGEAIWSRDADTLARWRDRNRQVASPLSSVASEILVIREGASRMILGNALGSIAQSTADSARRMAPVQILTGADAPQRPSYPSFPLLVVAGFLLGGFVGASTPLVQAIRRQIRYKGG